MLLVEELHLFADVVGGSARLAVRSVLTRLINSAATKKKMLCTSMVRPEKAAKELNPKQKSPTEFISAIPVRASVDVGRWASVAPVATPLESIGNEFPSARECFRINRSVPLVPTPRRADLTIND